MRIERYETRVSTEKSDFLHREREKEKRERIYLIFEARLANIERNSPRIFYFDFLGKRLYPNDTGLNYTNTNAFRSRPAPPAIVDLNRRAAKMRFMAYYSGLFSIFGGSSGLKSRFSFSLLFFLPPLPSTGRINSESSSGNREQDRMHERRGCDLSAVGFAGD